MKIGKLDSDLLKKIVFGHIKHKRDEVLIRPGIGEDCAVLDYGEQVCVVSTDPITGTDSEIGRLAIHISCNDIASSGAEPVGIMLALMLPEGTASEQISEIMRQAGEEAEKLNVEIIGGHTEITNAVVKPVIVSTAIGKYSKGAFAVSKKIKPGDCVLMTKTAGIEGTGIIASDFKGRLAGILTDEEMQEAQEMLNMLSVVREGLIAGRIGVNGMHDITEGGVLGAVWEMCEAAGTGVKIFCEKIPVSDITVKICKFFNIDYLRLISSGCMLIIVSPDKKERLISELEKENIAVSEIGEITDKGRYMVKNGIETEICPPESDELYKVR